MSVGKSPNSGWLQETRPERLHPAEPPGEGRPGKKWVAALVGLVVIFVVLGGYDLFSDRHLLGAKPTASAPRSVVRSATASAGRTASASAPASARAPGSPTASSPATPTPVRVLSAVSAVAFGPNGTSDGDNPGIAARVLAGDGVDAWQSAWYESAAFGNLQAGTGLLLDMGKRVSVSSVRLELGASVGADVQVRLGGTPELSGLSTAASAYGVGGTVRLTPSAPVRARYVLVWFTLLPPDSAGTYQVRVYSVKVDGRP